MRWEGQEQRRLTTPGDLKHVEALVAQYPGCAVHLAFEACGFGYELAWWAAERQIGVTVIAPSRMERTPGRQVKADRLDVGTLARDPPARFRRYTRTTRSARARTSMRKDGSY